MRVFIAHSTKDKVFVDELAANLQRNRIEVWYDKWEMQVGDSLRQKISEGIMGSKFMVVVLSENSIQSTWVREELNSGLALAMERDEPVVLPVLLRGSPTEIPVFLKDRVFADFRQNFSHGLGALLTAITGMSPPAPTIFVSRHGHVSWRDTLAMLPEDVKEMLQLFVRTGLDEFGVGIYDVELSISGAYEAELEFDRYFADTFPDQSLYLYGLISTYLESHRTWGRPKRFFFVGKLTRRGYMIAKELGYQGIEGTKLEFLPDA